MGGGCGLLRGLLGEMFIVSFHIAFMLPMCTAEIGMVID